MKLQNTLNKLYILLFLISFNAYSEELSQQVESCNVALNKGDYAKASSISDVILKANASNRDALLCKGRALGAQGNYAEALLNLENGAKQSTESFDQIIAYLLIANLHKQNNQASLAISHYEKSLSICLKTNNQKYAHINYNLMGETYSQNKDLAMALTSYKLGEKQAMNDNERADSQERIASTYSALGQHDAAIEYQIKAILMQRKSGTLDQYANASLAMGTIYLRAKELQNAEKTYSKLVQFAQENGGAYYEAKANIGLAAAKKELGDAAGAKSTLLQAKKIATSLGDADLIAEIEPLIKN